MEEETYHGSSEGQQGQPQQSPPQQGQPQQYPQEQYQQPQHTTPQEPKKPLFEKLASDNTIAMIIVLGLLVIMLGAVIISAAPFQTNLSAEEEFGDAADEEDDGLTTRERWDRQATENSMEYAGNVLTNIGLFLLASGVLIGVVLRDDWNKWLRIALAGFALVLIIFAWFGGEFVLGVGIA